MPLRTAFIRRLIPLPERVLGAEPIPGSSRVKRWCEHLLVAAACVAVVWFYAWTIKVNAGFDDWGDLDYYNLMVRGWTKGQLHLDKEPDPELLKLADPYDPLQNAPFKLGDATFYRGRYYIYFGAAPALTVMLPWRLLTGHGMTVGVATLVFCTLAFLTASGLWLAIRRRYFPGSMVVMAPAGVLAIGLGTHLLALAQRPMFWELAIASGIAFSCLAAAAAYRAIHGRRPMLAMAVAGLCVGLAVGSRPTCLLAAPLLLPPLWLAARRRRTTSEPQTAIPTHAPTRPGASWQAMAAAAAVPLIACGVAIMAHNYARFQNPLEFGQNYQLSGAHEGKLTHWSVRFMPHNFAVYFFQRLRWDAEFPFVIAPLIRIDDLPGYFGTEEVSGLCATFPFFWFLLGLPFAWWRRGREEAQRLSAALAIVAGYAIPVMAIVLCYFSTTMRYEADFAVGLAVLALVGMLALERRVRRRAVAEDAPVSAAGRWTRGAVVALFASLACGASAIAGVLVSFDYHQRPLTTSQPLTWQKLASWKHLALGQLGGWLGQIEGPRVIKVRFRPRAPGTLETFWEATDRRAGERVLVEHIGEHLIRFGYVRGEAPAQWGRPLRWEPNHTHTVTVQVPSLYPRPGDGWWDRVRRYEEFRERTAVAIWFSGGRALEAVVAPLPGDITAGGSVGRDFSGEVRGIGRRAYRPDEIAWGLEEYYAKRGGVLQMRILFPLTVQPEGEPLFISGEPPRSSNVYVIPAAGGVKIVFQNSGESRVESALIRPDARGHPFELEMPSFRPELYGWEATGDVVVRLDGREVLRTTQVAAPYGWGSEQIGRNFLGSTCGPYFRGWVLGARWVQPPRPAAAAH